MYSFFIYEYLFIVNLNTLMDHFYKDPFLDSYKGYYADRTKCKLRFNKISKYCVCLIVAIRRRLMPSFSGKKLCKVIKRKQY